MIDDHRLRCMLVTDECADSKQLVWDCGTSSVALVSNGRCCTATIQFEKTLPTKLDVHYYFLVGQQGRVILRCKQGLAR